MAYKTITSPDTEKDIEKAILWYKDIKIGLARSFIDELGYTRKHIQLNPRKFQIRYNNIRIGFLRKFPYGLHYKFEDDTITFVAVFHTSEDPQKWENR